MMHVSPVPRHSALLGDARTGAFDSAMTAGPASAAEALTPEPYGLERLLRRNFVAPVALTGGSGRARRYDNDNADVDRRPPPGGNPGCGSQGKQD